MSPASRKEYVRAIVERYQSAGRKEKQRILDEFCRICGSHRKHAIRTLRQTRRPKSARRKPGRASRDNTPEILAVLCGIWQTAPSPCAKRLKAILGCWIEPYEQRPSVFSPGGSSRRWRRSLPPRLTACLRRSAGALSATACPPPNPARSLRARQEIPASM